MRDIIKLFLVVAIFSAVAGGGLAWVKGATAERIELQELTYVRGPAIKMILDGCSNDPLVDRFKITDGEDEISFFVGEYDGKKNTVAFEVTGTGFGGDIGIMVGYNLDTDEVVGMGVTTSSETAGLGSRAKTDPAFRNQFKGMTINGAFKVKPDGGDIDALSGATVTSRGVCAGVANSIEIYKKLKNEILKKIQA